MAPKAQDGEVHSAEGRPAERAASLLQLARHHRNWSPIFKGSIGVDQLEDPFIALGLVQSRDEVQAMIDLVDKDKSHTIEFDEFLMIMQKLKKGKDDQKSSAIFTFFKKMVNRELMQEMDENLKFTLNVSGYRRRKILGFFIVLDAIMNGDKKNNESMKILDAFKKQLIFHKKKEKIAKGENPNGLSYA